MNAEVARQGLNRHSKSLELAWNVTSVIISSAQSTVRKNNSIVHVHEECATAELRRIAATPDQPARQPVGGASSLSHEWPFFNERHAPEKKEFSRPSPRQEPSQSLLTGGPVDAITNCHDLRIVLVRNLAEHVKRALGGVNVVFF